MTDVDARVVVVVVIIVVVLRTVLVLLVAALTGFIFAAVKVLRASLVDNVIVIIETSGVVLVDNGVGDLPKADKRPFSLFVVGMLAVVAAIAAGLAAVVGLGSAAAVLPARYFAALAACSKSVF